MAMARDIENWHLQRHIIILIRNWSRDQTNKQTVNLRNMNLQLMIIRSNVAIAKGFPESDLIGQQSEKFEPLLSF